MKTCIREAKLSKFSEDIFVPAVSWWIIREVFGSEKKERVLLEYLLILFSQPAGSGRSFFFFFQVSSISYIYCPEYKFSKARNVQN